MKQEINIQNVPSPTFYGISTLHPGLWQVTTEKGLGEYIWVYATPTYSKEDRSWNDCFAISEWQPEDERYEVMANLGLTILSNRIWDTYEYTYVGDKLKISLEA